MKISLIIICLLLHGVLLLSAENDPFGDSPTEPPRPERKITAMPKSITYRKVDNSKHVYTISGIYSNKKKGVINDDIDLSWVVPDRVGCKIDYDKDVCTLSTSRKLTMSELAYAVDDMAYMGGEIPYWLELEARDIPKGEFFGNADFIVKPFKGEVPKGLGWFWLDKRSAFTMPLYAVIGASTNLRIVPMTADCMAHSRFAIRILDSKGKLVWHNDSVAYAATRIAVVDFDGDGAHEILLDRDDHGTKARYVIQRK